MDAYILLAIIVASGLVVYYGSQALGKILLGLFYRYRPYLMSKNPFRWIRELYAVYVKGNMHFVVLEDRPWYEKEAAYGLTVKDGKVIDKALRERARAYDPGWVEHNEYMEKFRKRRKGSRWRLWSN